ncbi:MAG: HAD family hydrolase [Ruminococcaceae bacterium]|nr:HAD family hydrolase [Oscillospiraceae bacterium]
MEAVTEVMEKTEQIPTGLTTEEAGALINRGLCNKAESKAGKSYLRIIYDNLFTFFNMIWAIVTVVLISIGSYSNLTFLAVVLPNVLIATYQELRAKKTVEKLSVTTDPIATVVRDGEITDIFSSDIVVGDVMYLENGRQILSDGVVIQGSAEVNESMLTGESNAIKKKPGDTILAGSYLVGGAMYAKVTGVGKDNYVHKIEKAAKSFKAPASNLFKELNRLIKYIGIFLVPMSAVLMLVNYFAYEKDFVMAVNKTCGSIIGMIPSGIFLLVTLTLSLSVITLGKKGSLVREMYSIEMLASADVICLDKTGTITDGTMAVTAVIPLNGYVERYINSIMAMVEGSEESVNHTSEALIEHFGCNKNIGVIDKIPFSSSRKYSSVHIAEEGCFSIGAPRFVKCEITREMDFIISRHAAMGERVLVLVKQEALETMGEPMALIAISDKIRPNARDTIENFQSQGVAVKVISGDHAETVSSIAKRVEIKDAEKYVSCEKVSDEELAAMCDDYAVFGRVTPEQKILLVKALKARGHTVAMTGDGVNDTLALKESDCSIAMADGSEVARKVSKIVLMNSDFGVLPDIVKEGRRCINSVRMSSVLYLMKTLFTIILSLFSVITFSGYPFDPKQLLFVEMIVIGFSSLLLTVEPNYKRATGSYMQAVIRKSIPNAIVMLVPVFVTQVVEKFGAFEAESISAIATIAVTAASFLNLVFLCRPYTYWRMGVVCTSGSLLGLAVPLSIFLLDDMLNIVPLSLHPILFTVVMSVTAGLAIIIHVGLRYLKEYLDKRKALKAA